jgi:hypothetical protein
MTASNGVCNAKTFLTMEREISGILWQYPEGYPERLALHAEQCLLLAGQSLSVQGSAPDVAPLRQQSVVRGSS